LKSPADAGLTERQMAVLALMMQGKSNKAIGRALDLADATVKNHVSAVLRALNVTSRTEAVVKVGALGWTLAPNGTPATADPQGAGAEAAHTSAREPALATLQGPSIAVLPFSNLSDDPSQDYFADGMVEEITIALGRIPRLFV